MLRISIPLWLVLALALLFLVSSGGGDVERSKPLWSSSEALEGQLHGTPPLECSSIVGCAVGGADESSPRPNPLFVVQDRSAPAWETQRSKGKAPKTGPTVATRPESNRSGAANCAGNGPMDLDGLDRGIRALDKKSQRQGSAWQLNLKGRVLHVFADVKAQRMRIVSAITQAERVTDAQRWAMLEANFHTALDARYSISRGVVFAAFIHPLPSLSQRDLRSALNQVASLAANFGSSYSSDTLFFGTPQRRAPSTEDIETL